MKRYGAVGDKGMEASKRGRNAKELFNHKGSRSLLLALEVKARGRKGIHSESDKKKQGAAKALREGEKESFVLGSLGESCKNGPLEIEEKNIRSERPKIKKLTTKRVKIHVGLGYPRWRPG